MADHVRKSPPICVPVALTPKWPDRFHNSDPEVHQAQAEVLHPELNKLTDGKPRLDQHSAACNLVRTQVLHIWVTVDEHGMLALAEAPCEK